LHSNREEVLLQCNQLVDKLVVDWRENKMTTVGAFEAKTTLNALLKKVAKGETIQITLRGVPVAKLVPADSDEAPDPRSIVRDIRDLRKGVTLGKIPIRDLIEQGRRH
jgi:prevent-host-death family protein